MEQWHHFQQPGLTDHTEHLHRWQSCICPGAPTETSSTPERAGSVPDIFPTTSPSPESQPNTAQPLIRRKPAFPGSSVAEVFRALLALRVPALRMRSRGKLGRAARLGMSCGHSVRARGDCRRQPQPWKRVSEEGERSPKGMKDARRWLSQWGGWIWLSWLQLGGRARRQCWERRGAELPHPLQRLGAGRELGQHKQPVLGPDHSLGRPMAESV